MRHQTKLPTIESAERSRKRERLAMALLFVILLIAVTMRMDRLLCNI